MVKNAFPNPFTSGGTGGTPTSGTSGSAPAGAGSPFGGGSATGAAPAGAGSPFGGGAAPAGAGSPFGGASPYGGSGSPFGGGSAAGAAPAGAGSPFGGGSAAGAAPAGAGSPFGGTSPYGGSGSPFGGGAAPAGAGSPFGSSSSAASAGSPFGTTGSASTTMSGASPSTSAPASRAASNQLSFASLGIALLGFVVYFMVLPWLSSIRPGVSVGRSGPGSPFLIMNTSVSYGQLNMGYALICFLLLVMAFVVSYLTVTYALKFSYPWIGVLLGGIMSGFLCWCVCELTYLSRVPLGLPSYDAANFLINAAVCAVALYGAAVCGLKANNTMHKIRKALFWIGEWVLAVVAVVLCFMQLGIFL